MPDSAKHLLLSQVYNGTRKTKLVQMLHSFNKVVIQRANVYEVISYFQTSGSMYTKTNLKLLLQEDISQMLFFPGVPHVHTNTPTHILCLLSAPTFPLQTKHSHQSVILFLFKAETRRVSPFSRRKK